MYIHKLLLQTAQHGNNPHEEKASSVVMPSTLGHWPIHLWCSEAKIEYLIGTMPGVLFKGNFYTAFWCLVEYMQHWHWYKLLGAAQFTLWSIHIEHCTLKRTRCCIALFTLFSNFAIFNHPIDKYFVSNVHSFMYVCNQAKGYYLRRWRCYWKNNLYMNTKICV